jgi:hypothetical protein
MISMVSPKLKLKFNLHCGLVRDEARFWGGADMGPLRGDYVMRALL